MRVREWEGEKGRGWEGGKVRGFRVLGKFFSIVVELFQN